MTDSVSATVTGGPELNARLLALTPEIRRKVLRPAVAVGAGLLRRALKAAAPVAPGPVRRGAGVVTQPGTLQRAGIIKFARELTNETQVGYVVTFRQGKRQQKSNRDAFYATWVDKGHLIVPRRRNVARRGELAYNRVKARAAGKRVPGRNFFEPTIAANADRASQATIDKATTALDKLLA